MKQSKIIQDNKIRAPSIKNLRSEKLKVEKDRNWFTLVPFTRAVLFT